MRESFHDAIRAAGLIPPDVIEPGRFYRFNGDGKRNGNTAGWCKLFTDGDGGIFGDWSTGLSEHWQALRDKPMSAADHEAWRKRIEEARREADAEQARTHAEAAKLAKSIYDLAGKDVTGHPYAMRKGINLGPLVRRGAWSQRGWDDALIVPLFNADRKIVSLEAINADGDKDFLKGGAKKGAFHPLGKISEAKLICIGEGLATVAVAGGPVVAAMDAGNLLAAAKGVRQINPNAEIVFLADNDVREDGRNPGIEAATDAARAVGGRVAIPELDGRKCDFWDVWNEQGVEAVAQAVAGAIEPERGEHQPGDENPPAGEYARDVNLIRASDVTPEAIAWLWNGWLAAGKMHILGGAPGTGKTTLAMALAATLTTGGRWPDGTRSIAGNVVIWSGEDDPADTLIPRLALLGADLSRVYFIADIREGNERRSFDPARDMEPLRRKLAEIGGVKLLIVDPVVSAVTGEGNSNPQVRRSLQPLVDIGKDIGCAVIGITHFRKSSAGSDPVERINGSIAYAALARVVLVAAKYQEEGDDGRTVRLFCRAKSNIGPDDGGFEYDLQQAEWKAHPGIFASSVLWGEAVEGAARELLATADATGDDGEGGTLADAKRFLADLLADRPLPTKIIRADADGAGYSWATIRRAQKALGIEPAKEGMKGGWVWRMPGQEAAQAILANAKMLKNAEDAQPKEVSTFEEIEHLRGESGAVEVEI
jgi:putative DNA primase/helicase